MSVATESEPQFAAGSHVDPAKRASAFPRTWPIGGTSGDSLANLPGDSGTIEERVINEVYKSAEGKYIDAHLRGYTKKSFMLTIHGGVLESHVDSNRFEAAVETDHGPKTLVGTMDVPTPHGDIQSLPAREWRPSIERLEDAIRHAAELSVDFAVRKLSEIWESIEATGRLAEARLRVKLPKLVEPPLANRPDWLNEQLPELDRGDHELAASHPLAIAAADRLVRACMEAVTSDITATLERAPLGNVIVDWHVGPHSLQWEVAAARLPWPGIQVNVLIVRNSDKPQAHTRIFHTAFEVVEHFREQLNEFGIQTGMH